MKRLYKTLLLVKWENIALTLFIPVAIIQFYKAHIDYKLLSVLMSLVLYGGTYLTIIVSRKEALQELRNIKPITSLTIITNIRYLVKSIQKEINIHTRYKDDQVQYKKCF